MKKKFLALLIISAFLILGTTTAVISVPPKIEFVCWEAVLLCNTNCGGSGTYTPAEPYGSFYCNCMRTPGPGNGCPWTGESYTGFCWVYG